mmetsp:Transcript_25219/g.41889  ORF Transcript_25219/g.41889 Transcript_25219/m.41889 type:complete len:80 (+) Transcript_25219:237-476(+)
MVYRDTKAKPAKKPSGVQSLFNENSEVQYIYYGSVKNAKRGKEWISITGDRSSSRTLLANTTEKDQKEAGEQSLAGKKL